jgi:hypothetical protein
MGNERHKVSIFPIPFCSVVNLVVDQISRQPVLEGLDLDKWDHSDLGSWGCQDTTSQFSLEDFINFEPSLSCGEDFQCGKTQVNGEQYRPGRNNQLHGMNFPDDKVEMISLGGSGESCFPTDSETGENPLYELLRSELEAEMYLKSGPLERNFN